MNIHYLLTNGIFKYFVQQDQYLIYIPTGCSSTEVYERWNDCTTWSPKGFVQFSSSLYRRSILKFEAGDTTAKYPMTACVERYVLWYLFTILHIYTFLLQNQNYQ